MLRSIAAFAVVFLLVTGRLHAAADVWIDTDPAIGLPLRDADDGLALVQALHSPELTIGGISVSYGNGPLPFAVAITREIASRFGGPARVRPEQVHAGAASASELGHATAATHALASALREHPLTYIALGPLTNLATFLRLEPALAARIERVIVLASRRPGERFRVGTWNPYPFHDPNFEKDPAAMAELLRSGVPISFVPMSITLECIITAHDMAVLRGTGLAGAWIEERTRMWLRIWRWLFVVEGAPMFDSVAILAVTHPDLFATAPCQPRIEIQGRRERLFASPGAEPANARVVTMVRPDARRVILERLAARPPH